MRHPKSIRSSLLYVAAAILMLTLCAVQYQPAHATVIEDPGFVYEQAMYFFKQGEQKLANGEADRACDDLEQSLRLFMSIELFSDSKEWIVKIELMVNPSTSPVPSTHTIESLECYEATATQLMLSWEDSEPSAYTVTWNPARAKTEPKTITTSQMGVAIEGLMPSTRYTIQVSPSNGVPLSGSFETKPAPDYTDYGFLPMDLLGNWLNQYKQSIAAAFGFHNMLENYDQLKESDGLTSLQGVIAMPPTEPGTHSPLHTQDVGFAVSHSFMLPGAPERMTLTRRAVLRVPGVGVFEDTEDVLMLRSSLYTVHVDLTDMLEAVFAAMGGWDRKDMTLELYFDGCLAFTDAITLSVGQPVAAEASTEGGRVWYMPSTPTSIPRSTPTSAPAVQWRYTLNRTEATITGHEGEKPSGHLVIPSEVDGHKVTGIGQSAFSGCKGLTSVVIPSSVINIGESAFMGCSSLQSVTILNNPNRVSLSIIGLWAFEGCSSLESVTIPDSVGRIGSWAFEGCRSLSSLAIPSGVNDISPTSFADCPNLTLVVEPGSYAELYARSEGAISYRYK